jgi:uncharacterized cupredoxin-like copper-binding protein
VILLAIGVAAVAIAFGMLFGNWVSNHRKSSADLQRVDEYLGLGERTGLTGNITLQVDPCNLEVKAGEPAKVRLILKNEGHSRAYLNGWLDPTPANLGNNQFPIKVSITRDKEKIHYQGNFLLPPPHSNKDFFTLDPGKSREISVDLSRCAGNGRWEMFSPGIYTVEVWYETYLTGRYIGINAWTGTTNHVIVQIKVAAEDTQH